MLPRRIRTISTNTASFGPYKTSTRSVTILASPSLIPGIGTIGPIMDSAVKIVSAITENIASAVIFLISILFAFSALLLLSFFFVSIFVYSFLILHKIRQLPHILSLHTMRYATPMDVVLCLI